MSRTPQLEYAAPLPKRKRYVRWGLITCLALSIGFVFWRVAPIMLSRIYLLYLERQCLRFMTDPNQPAKSGPDSWQQFGRVIVGHDFPAVPTVFLHERIAHNGEHRLVVVTLIQSQSKHVFIDAESFSIATVLNNPFGESRLVDGSVASLLELPISAQVFGGELDPSDSSHFTFRVREINGQEYLVDGWLRGDGQVLIEQRVNQPSSLPTSQ